LKSPAGTAENATRRNPGQPSSQDIPRLRIPVPLPESSTISR
jgi:hypothetical protein